MRRRCDLSREMTESEFILCTPKAKLMSCGNEIKQNDTHVVFMNSVQLVYPLASHLNLSLLKAAIPWECAYPLKLVVETQYLPVISPITIFRANKSATGEFKAAMFLYKDEGYQQPYDSVPHLHMDDRLRIKVQLLRGPQNSKLQVVKCWGASGILPGKRYETYTLIDDFCPVAKAARAEIFIRNNGDRHHSLWESNVFRFVSHPTVFIHCHVKVCFDGASCKKECVTSDSLKRRRREIREPGFGLLTLGPLEVGLDVSRVTSNEKQTSNSGTTQELNTLQPKTEETLLLGMPKTVTFIVIAGIVLIFFLLILGVSIAIHRKIRDGKRKTKKFWEDQLANKQRLSKTFTLSNGPPFEIPLSVPNTLKYTDIDSSERRK